MNKVFLLLSLVIFMGCNGSQKSHATDTLIAKTGVANTGGDTTDPNANQAKEDASDGDDTPTQEEERQRISKSYDDVKIIDSMFIDNNDTLHFHLKYYCLDNRSLVIPQHYDLDGKKEFVTHPFVSDISLIHNRDTVLKKEFNSTDFNSFFTDNFGGNLKTYGSMDMPHLSKRNGDKSQVIVHCPIIIPSTDIGIGLYLIISKTGDYKIVENL